MLHNILHNMLHNILLTTNSGTHLYRVEESALLTWLCDVTPRDYIGAWLRDIVGALHAVPF